MFFVVILSLAALASAGPVIQHELQQKEVEDANSIPFYKQQFNPSSMNIYEHFRSNRYIPHYGQMKENYPFQPYNYKNFMTYPYRSNYFLRYMNKPEMGVAQPKVDYDSQDIYHLHDINHHHMINNIHDFKQKEMIRKLNEMDYPYIPYSPMYYNKYMNNRDYPYVNKYYGKSMEQEYVQPWNNNYYNRYWDMDYMRNYYSRNLDYPTTARNLEVEYFKPVVPKSMEYVKPTISKNLDLEYVKPIISKNVDLEYVKPIISKNWDLDFVTPVISKSLNVDFVKPVISKNLDLDYVQPAISKNLDVEYVKPVITKNLNMDYVKPIISKKLETDWIPFTRNHMEYSHQPALMRNFGADYMQPEMQPIKHQSQDVEFVPEVSRRNLDDFVPDYYNWDFEQDTPSDGRFKRDVHAETATNVEQTHQATVTGQHHEVAHQPIPQGVHVQRQDLEVNANPEQVPVPAEPVSQQPIQRQTRDTIAQSVVTTPQYVYYPYYLDPYLPVQTPLVVRSAYSPNYYYNLLYRK